MPAALRRSFSCGDLMPRISGNHSEGHQQCRPRVSPRYVISFRGGFPLSTQHLLWAIGIGYCPLAAPLFHHWDRPRPTLFRPGDRVVG
jgi:hypothetical protein